MMITEEIKNRLNKIFSEDTCYPGCHWTSEKPSTGHCAITALIVQEELGGKIAKVRMDRSHHYFNVINDEIVDLTADQFDKPVNYKYYKLVNIKQLKNNTKERYLIFKERYEKAA